MIDLRAELSFDPPINHLLFIHIRWTSQSVVVGQLVQMENYRSSSGRNLPDYVQTVVVKGEFLFVFNCILFSYSLFKCWWLVLDSKGLEKILLLPKALDLDRPKRSRTAFAKWQLDALENTFCSHPYLVGEQRTLLARRLGLSETQVFLNNNKFILIENIQIRMGIDQSVVPKSKDKTAEGRRSAAGDCQRKAVGRRNTKSDIRNEKIFRFRTDGTSNME